MSTIITQLFNDRRLSSPDAFPKEAAFGITYMELADKLHHQYGESYQKNRMLSKKGHLPGSTDIVPLSQQIEAASRFIDDCTAGSGMLPRLIDQLKEAEPAKGQQVLITVPISLLDLESRNVLAPAFAQHVASALEEAIGKDAYLRELGLSVTVTDDLRQLSKCDRTGANIAGRIARQHLFGGKVSPEALYIITDDDLEMCSTACNAAHYITQKGGKVVAVAAPAIAPGAHLMHILPETQEQLLYMVQRDTKETNPDALVNGTLVEFGLSLNRLTNNEGLLMVAAMADREKDRPVFEHLLTLAGGLSISDLEKFHKDGGSKAQIHSAFDSPAVSFEELARATQAELNGPNGRVVSHLASQYLG